MTQMQDAPVDESVIAEAEETAGGNRRALVLLGIVAALLLAAAGWFLLGGGSSSGDDPGSSFVPVVQRPAGTPPKAVAKPAATLPPVSTVKLGRDPFHAQYVLPVAPVAAGSGTGGTGTATGTGTGTGTATGTPGTQPAATTYALKLSRVDGTGSDLTAKFLVGATKKIQFARAGSVFGATGEIRLLSIERGPNGAGTAVIQVGDDTPFDVSTTDAAIFVQ